MKTVSSATLAGVAELIDSYGVDPEAIARQANIDILALSNSDLTLDGEAVLRFFDLATNLCGDRFFGIELAQRQGWEILGPVWILIRNSEDLREAMHYICEGLQLFSNGLAMRAVPEKAGIAYTYDVTSDEIVFSPQAVELAFAIGCNEVRALAGNKWNPGYVQFRHAQPDSLKRHWQVFGESISFNQDRNALFIDNATLALKYNHHDDKVRSVIKRAVDHRKRTSPENFASRVEMIVRNLISSDVCEAEIVASTLGMTVRTMQYKLADSGTSYQRILDNVRDNLSCKYLLDSDLSVAEIAELLQFSETSAFSRFFSRRKGVSPRQYRKRVDH